MSRFKFLAVAAGLVMTPSAAFAQTADATPETPAVTVSGSASLVSDYRFRGISQTDTHMAVQAGLTATHKSGVYGGLWASNLAQWGTYGGANMELDVLGGYKASISPSATIDVGLVWYMYPGGSDKTDNAEAYARLTGTTGPVQLTAGIAYSPPQEALGKWYDDGASAAAGVYDRTGVKGDNLYLSGDGAYTIEGTPLTARAHIGHSWGQDGLGPNVNATSPTGAYWDWSLGADATWRDLTLGVAWIGSDLTYSRTAYLLPAFSKGMNDEGSIAGNTVVVSLTAGF